MLTSEYQVTSRGSFRSRSAGYSPASFEIGEFFNKAMKTLSKTIATSWFADEITQEFQRLDGFLRLKVGWNGYSALPPNEKSVATAKQYLALMVTKDENYLSRVAPSALGGVGITQRFEGRKVYVEFYNDGTVHALYSDGNSEPETRQIDPTEQAFRHLVDSARAYLYE